SFVTVTNASSAQIVASHVDRQRLAFEIKAAAPALLVLAQTYFHPWRAYVNGQPTKIWRANHAFQAIEVPAGHSEVKFVYKDGMLLSGSILSGVAMLVCAALWRGSGLLKRSSGSPLP